MNIYRIAAIATALLITACSPKTTKTDSALLQDYDSFFSQLEEIHPDPYSAFGGERKFRRSVARLRRDLASRDTLTFSEMQFEVNALLSTLHDGHTRMGWSDVPAKVEQKWIPVNFRVIPEGLVINATAKDYERLSGAKVLKVNGSCINKVLERLDRLVITENRFGLLDAAKDYLRNTNTLRAIFPDFDSDFLELSLRLKDGSDTTVSLPFYPNDSPVWGTFVYPPSVSGLPRGNHDFCFADSARTTMVYRMKSVTSADIAWSDDSHVIAEVFQDMLNMMKEAGSSTLVIDLRGNGGGDTSITYAALYELYGNRFLTTDLGFSYSTKISVAFLEKYNRSLEDIRRERGDEINLGDMMESDGHTSDIEHFTCSRKDILRAQNGEAVYTPENVYVLTDAYTFSAAFHFAYMLQKMGAKIIGVPSGQSPNTFMESTVFTLPYSGFRAQSSNSVQTIFPEDDKRAHILWPDIMLTYDEYKALNFNLDAEILYLLQRKNAAE